MIGWEQVLIYLGSGIGGVLIGFLAYLLVKRMPNRARSRPTQFPGGEPRKTMTEEQIELGVVVHNGHSELAGDLPPRPAPAAQILPVKSEILIEVENNLAVATSPWTGKMASFETEAWDDSGGKVESVPSELYGDLMEAYADMRLANTLVWLSSDVGRKNKDLDQSYLTLCTKISERLQRAMPALTHRS